MGEDFETVLIDLLKDYYDTFKLEPVNAQYIIADDLAAAHSKLRPDQALENPEQMKILANYNGEMVCPEKVGGVFTVLINREKLIEYINSDNRTWIGTIIHETTHVRDFTDFAALIKASDYEDILKIENNLPFQLWTEFNAKAKGYYFVRKYSYQDMFDVTQTNDIINRELPMQERLLYNNYHGTSSGFQQLYYVCHFLGRLYCLRKVFPSVFTDEWINAMPLFIHNKWMKEWYWFLEQKDTLEKAYPHFSEMRCILRQNFRWV